MLAAFSIAAAIGVITAGCASMQIRRAQQRRAHLGAYLYTETAGEGPETLVFLPGLMGSTAFWRNADTSSLSNKRLIFVDLLGFGRSPWPEIEYTLDDQISALRRTLVRDGATKHVTLVAHSFGTVVAAYYAARFPEEVDHLFLFGTPMYRNKEGAAERVREMSWLAGLLVRSPFAARLVCTIHNAFMPILARLAPRVRRDLPATVARDGVLHFWPSLDGSVQHVILEAPLQDALKAVGRKTTIVFGSKDTVSERAFVEEVTRDTGARFALTGDDHVGYWRSWPGYVRR